MLRKKDFKENEKSGHTADKQRTSKKVSSVLTHKGFVGPDKHKHCWTKESASYLKHFLTNLELWKETLPPVYSDELKLKSLESQIDLLMPNRIISEFLKKSLEDQTENSTTEGSGSSEYVSDLNLKGEMAEKFIARYQCKPLHPPWKGRTLENSFLIGNSSIDFSFLQEYLGRHRKPPIPKAQSRVKHVAKKRQTKDVNVKEVKNRKSNQEKNGVQPHRTTRRKKTKQGTRRSKEKSRVEKKESLRTLDTSTIPRMDKIKPLTKLKAPYKECIYNERIRTDHRTGSQLKKSVAIKKMEVLTNPKYADRIGPIIKQKLTQKKMTYNEEIRTNKLHENVSLKKMEASAFAPQRIKSTPLTKSKVEYKEMTSNEYCASGGKASKLSVPVFFNVNKMKFKEDSLTDHSLITNSKQLAPNKELGGNKRKKQRESKYLNKSSKSNNKNDIFRSNHQLFALNDLSGTEHQQKLVVSYFQQGPGPSDEHIIEEEQGPGGEGMKETVAEDTKEAEVVSTEGDVEGKSKDFDVQEAGQEIEGEFAHYEDKLSEEVSEEEAYESPGTPTVSEPDELEDLEEWSQFVLAKCLADLDGGGKAGGDVAAAAADGEWAVDMESVKYSLRPESSRTSLPPFIYEIFETAVEAEKLEEMEKLKEDVEEGVVVEEVVHEVVSEECIIERIESDYLIAKVIDHQIDSIFANFRSDVEDALEELRAVDDEKYYIDWQIVGRRIRQNLMPVKDTLSYRTLPPSGSSISEEPYFITDLKASIGPDLVQAITQVLLNQPVDRPVEFLVKVLRHIIKGKEYEIEMNNLEDELLRVHDDLFSRRAYLPRKFKLLDEYREDSSSMEFDDESTIDAVSSHWDPYVYVQQCNRKIEMDFLTEVREESEGSTSEIEIIESSVISGTSHMTIGSSIYSMSFEEPSDMEIVPDLLTMDVEYDELMENKRKFPEGYAMDPNDPLPFSYQPEEDVEEDQVDEESSIELH